MTEKRFTLHKGIDTLNIMDNTKFNEHIYINKSSKDMKLLVGVLNALHEENEQLKKELEDWKSNCLSTINENSILWNEIAIMREQGAKPSSAFEEYCSKFKGDVND